MNFIKQSALTLLLVIVLIPVIASADISVTFLDVGQGDAAIIQADGKNMLINAGPNDNAGKLLSYLNSIGINHLDVAVGTHPHEDYIGGMDKVLANYDVSAIWLPEAMAETQTFEKLLIAIKNKGLTITAPKSNATYSLGKAQITVLAPVHSAYDGLNDDGIVLRIDYGVTSFLITCDAQEISEKEILQYQANVDVLKVGHHSSGSSLSNAFLDVVSPVWAVISCRIDNTYEHPDEETFIRLEEHGSIILRTDIKGPITFVSDGKELKLKEIVVTGRTIADSANLLASASAKAEKVATLKKGTTVSILGNITVSGDIWYHIDADGASGYIRSNLLTVLPIASILSTTVASVAKPNEENEVGNQPEPIDTQYIGNKNSKKFHLPSCHSLPDEKNCVYFTLRDDAIAAGYDPCKKCNP